jgi:hypothetical protein
VLLFAPKEFIQNRQHLLKSTPFESCDSNKNQITSMKASKNWKIAKSKQLLSKYEGSFYFVNLTRKKIQF